MSVYSLAYVPCAVEHGCVGAGTTLVTHHHQDCRVLYQQASHFSSAPHYSDYSITSLLQPYCFALRCSPFPVATRGAEFCEVVCHMILTWQYPASHVWNRQRALSQKERNCRLIISHREERKWGRRRNKKETRSSSDCGASVLTRLNIPIMMYMCVVRRVKVIYMRVACVCIITL